MPCPIAESISKYADEPEQLSASEILNHLLKGNPICINNVTYDELVEITDLISSPDLAEAAQENIEGDKDSILKLYLKTIVGLM